MTDANEWGGRVGESWAREWRRTDRSFGPLTDQLLDHPAARQFDAALDIGCGAGELSCRLAEQRPDAVVTGVDISPDLLAAARERCSRPRFIDADASRFIPDGPAPDLLMSRHGVMFFDQPVAAFTHFASIAAPGATLRFSCFRTRSENGWAMELASVLPVAQVSSDPHAPGPFAFGDRERVESILGASGWSDIACDAIDYPMLAGEGVDAVEEALAYFLRIGPAARAIAELADDTRNVAIGRLRALLCANVVDGRVTLPAACWIVTARAAG